MRPYKYRDTFQDVSTHLNKIVPSTKTHWLVVKRTYVWIYESVVGSKSLIAKRSVGKEMTKFRFCISYG